MPRLMSVTKTKDAVYERRKTQTRRAGWTFLHLGDRLCLCEKVMGRRKGDPLVRICEVEVTGIRREPLNAITQADVAAEGFPDWTSAEFVVFFCDEMGGGPGQDVTVITWRYVCECPDRSDPRYHGGHKVCPRDPADHDGILTSPALCLPCLHGCDVT